MKKTLSLILAVVLALLMVPAAAFAAEGEVAVDEAHFPDELFRQYVALKVDADGNGSLSEEEILKTDWISIENSGVADLTGIEIFTELSNLNCGGNQLTKLDVRHNTKLERLICSDNQLAELDLSSNPGLADLHCYGNQLTELDVSHNPNLYMANCHNNPLQTLYLQGAEKLQVVNCVNCQLRSIDVSANPNLKVLECQGNFLTALDVSHNPALEYLAVGKIFRDSAGTVWDRSGNQLTELDVSHNSKLMELDCDLNNLTSLDLSGNPNVERVGCEENTWMIADGTACSELPGFFDTAKVSGVQGGTMDGGKIHFVAGSDQMTYNYAIGNGETVSFTLTKDPDQPTQPVEPETPTEPEHSDGTQTPSIPDTSDTSNAAEGAQNGGDSKEPARPQPGKKYKTDGMGNLLLDGYKVEKGTIRVRAADVEAIAKAVSGDKKCKGVTFRLGASTVTYDRKAIEHIWNEARDAEAIEITLQAVIGKDSGMNEAQQAVAKSYPDGTIFQLSLKTVSKEGEVKEVHGFSGGYAVTRVPFQVPKDETMEVFRLEEDGTLTKVEHFWDGKDAKMGWKTPSHSYYMIKAAGEVHDTDQESGSGRMIAAIAGICAVGAAAGAVLVVRRRRNH